MRRDKFHLGVLAAIFLTSPCLAEDVFLARTYRHPSGETMPYRLFVPRNYDSRQRYPLVLWLHGSGGRGRDNRMQISEANRLGTHFWTRPENQSRYPCFVLAPQGDAWVQPDSWEPTRELQLVVEIIHSVQREFSIDPRRLYVAGQSMGGYGTWAIILEHPNMFAAAIPICGGGDVSRAAPIAHLPIWVFHGDRDPVVGVEESRNMVTAIRKAGGNPRYSEYKGAGHNVWERVFKERDLLSWVFSHVSQD